MKNCIEHPGHWPPEFAEYRDESRKKLVQHLTGEYVKPQTLTEEDLRLFQLAAQTWKTAALHDICQQAQDQTDGPVRIPRRRTVSENVTETSSHDMPRRKASTASLKQPSNARRNAGQSYLILFGEAGGKTNAIVMSLRNGTIFQKVINTSDKPAHLKCVGCGYDDDAPFLYFLHGDSKNRSDLTPYDVLESKMKSRVRLKGSCEISHVINTGSFMACFQRNSDTVQMFHITKNRWAQPLKLLHPVNMPVLVSHGNDVYIFSENSVQCYEAVSGKVTVSKISEIVSTGYGFVFEGRLNILSDSSRIEYDVITGSCRRVDFPYLDYQPLHAAFVRNNVAFVLTTDIAGNFELLGSNDLTHWNRVHALSFPKRLILVGTAVVDFSSPCPFAPFQSLDESFKRPKFTLS